MIRAVLCCDSSIPNVGDIRHIWAKDKLTEIQLQARGIVSKNICDVDLLDIDASLRKQIEFGLQMEAKRGGVYSWIEIAYQHVYWRFARYYQYKLRLEKLIKQNGVEQLVLSSIANSDLVFACRAASNGLNIHFEALTGGSNPDSSSLSFSASYDLPSSISVVDCIAGYFLAFAYRISGVRTFFQPYHNLGGKYEKAAVFTWRRTLCLTGKNLPIAKLGHSWSMYNIDTNIRHDHCVSLDPDAWGGFDAYDREALASALSYFCQRYKASYLNQISKLTRKFLRRSGAARILLNSDNTCTTRLLSKSAKAEGLQVDYMPHGLVWEDLTLNLGTDCGADRVLAWNEASVRAYQRRGMNAKAISHPSCNKDAVGKIFIGNIAALRVLVLPPEWIGLTYAGRPDCFERDVLDVLNTLRELGINSVSIKCHNSTAETIQKKMWMLNAIKPYAKMDFEILDSGLPTNGLYEKFDLVIVGPTTGILEVSRSSTPFICFRAMLHKAGTFDDYKLPCADTVEELQRLILSYDLQQTSEQCVALGQSLTGAECALGLI